MPRDGRIAVVGATGAVGREALAILAARGVPGELVRPIASARSAGAGVPYGEGRLLVEPLSTRAFDGCATAIFAADADTGRRFAPAAVEAGAVVVDNSSAFRMDPTVPLVVPEVNGQEAQGRTLIANPNCTTIILLVALEPLRRCCGIEAIDVATYQAVSGAGLAGIDALLSETRAALDGSAHPAATPGGVFAEPCAFNVFSHDSPVDAASGVNGEERKVIDETRRIWNDPTVRVTPTCVRVPVVRAHTEAITVTLARPSAEAELRDALARAEGIDLMDDRVANAFPTPAKAGGGDRVLVGRLRPDPGETPDPRGRQRRWCLLACADQLRKGAALNAIQIADSLGLLPAPEHGRSTLLPA